MRAVVAVARKDLLSEWRSRELVPALAQFILLALVIAVFAFDVDAQTAGRIAPGVLWLVLLFAGLVGFGRAFAAEKEQASLEALLLTPAGSAAVFLGKAAAAAAVLLVCEAVLIPGLALFLGVLLSPVAILGVALSTIGMATLGCLFSALAVQTRARELLLPVLALPLWVPFIVFGAGAVTGHRLDGDVNLLVLDILFVVVAGLGARFVLDD
ncbi:MAG TPA: heme exporter protein CcmB [Candidatus Dormibacteraeota bacterium]